MKETTVDKVARLGLKANHLQAKLFDFFYRLSPRAAKACFSLTSPEELETKPVFTKVTKNFTDFQWERALEYAEAIADLVREIKIIYDDAVDEYYELKRELPYKRVSYITLERISDLVGVKVKTKKEALKELAALIKACKRELKSLGKKKID